MIPKTHEFCCNYVRLKVHMDTEMHRCVKLFNLFINSCIMSMLSRLLVHRSVHTSLLLSFQMSPRSFPVTFYQPPTPPFCLVVVDPRVEIQEGSFQSMNGWLCVGLIGTALQFTKCSSGLIQSLHSSSERKYLRACLPVKANTHKHC